MAKLSFKERLEMTPTPFIRLDVLMQCPTLEVGFVVLVGILLTGCEKHVTWQEEVKLSTGEIITIERDVRHKGGGAAWPQGQGSVPMEHIIRFRYPAQTGPLIEWHSTKVEPQGTYAELPLILDISADKTWFIFTKTVAVPGCKRYVKYQLQNGVWIESPLAEDIEIHSTNLFLAAGGVGIEGLITLAEKAKENSDLGYPADIKKVGPKKYSCVWNYNGPYPPVETPPDCRRYPMHPACER